VARGSDLLTATLKGFELIRSFKSASYTALSSLEVRLFDSSFSAGVILAQFFSPLATVGPAFSLRSVFSSTIVVECEPQLRQSRCNVLPKTPRGSAGPEHIGQE
jgi:hypothetical protein